MLAAHLQHLWGSNSLDIVGGPNGNSTENIMPEICCGLSDFEGVRGVQLQRDGTAQHLNDKLYFLQALSGEDAEVLAARVVMYLGSAEKATADAVREVIRMLKKVDAQSLPNVSFPSTSSIKQSHLFYVQDLP